MRPVQGDIQPAASGSVQQAACCTMACQRRCLDGSLVCSRRRLLGCKRIRASRETTTATKPVYA